MGHVDFLDGPGEMATRMRAYDWTTTSLGTPERWPSGLRTAVRLLLNSHHPMHIFWGPEAIFFYNDGFVPSAGPERHPSALGRPASESWGDIWPVIRSEIAKVRNGGGHTWYEDRHVPILRRGRLEDAYWTYGFSPIDDDTAPNGTGGVISILTETTRRKALEEDLRALNASLQEQVALQAAERDRIWQVSRDMLMVSDRAGVLLSVNPAWTRVLGWSAEDLIGQTSEWLEHPDDYAKTRAEIAKLWDGATTPAFENRFRARDGNYRTLSWTAVPVDDRFYCTARDITAEKAQAVALAEQTLRLKLFHDVIQASEAPICVFDTECRLIAFNRAHSDEFYRIFRHRVERGEVFPDLFPPEQAPIMRGFMARALAGETYTVTEEFGDPDLAKPYWEVTYYPLRDPEGRIIGAFHYAKDITFRVRAEAELAAIQEALRQSQKMEAVGQLTGGLAHDFNNLLAVVTGSLELLERRVAQGRISEIDRFVVAAQTAAKRATALTHRLLAFSRRQTLDPKPTDANQLIASMDDMIRRTVGPQIAVETRGAAGLWTTLVDSNQLENALLNLCINARDAMPDGGRLTIETANPWLDDRAAKTRDLPPGQYVSLCVSDTGCGMPIDVIAKAFDPFFTTKPIGQGTGLGLSMIYGFTRQSGGQVRIDSEVGQGTSVTIYLPRYLGDAAAGDEFTFDQPEQAKQGETVLVVDDEPGVRMLVAEVLEELGYRVIEAEDGPAALRVVASNARIDLIVTDVGLPGGMNGRQVADAARAARSDLKVMFITGYAENAVLGNGHLDPGMSVITKPFAVDNLANRIKELISQK